MHLQACCDAYHSPKQRGLSGGVICVKPKANGATCFFVLVGFAGWPFCVTRTSPANGAMEPVTRKPQDQSDCEMSLVTDVLMWPMTSL